VVFSSTGSGTPHDLRVGSGVISNFYAVEDNMLNVLLISALVVAVVTVSFLPTNEVIGM
jgi:hypothetical protein